LAVGNQRERILNVKHDDDISHDLVISLSLQ